MQVVEGRTSTCVRLHYCHEALRDHAADGTCKCPLLMPGMWSVGARSHVERMQHYSIAV